MVIDSKHKPATVIFPDWPGGDPIATQAGKNPHGLACIDTRSDERLSWADLDKRVSRMGGWLTQQLGAPLGERIAWLGRNGVDQLAFFFACHRVGAIAQPLNWRLSGEELGALIADADAKLVMYETEFEAQAQLALKSLPSARAFHLDPVKGGFGAIAADSPPASIADVAPDAPFVLLYTSGTTGKPKGVTITRKGAYFCAYNFLHAGDVRPGDIMLCDAPMFHTVGLMAVARTAMEIGATAILSDRFLPDVTLKRLSDRTLGVTHYFSVPQIAQMLRDHPDYPKADLTTLRGLFTGGAPMPPALIKAFIDDGVMLANGFGMSEAGTVMGMPLDRDKVREKLESCGVPAPAVQVRIVDSHGEDVQQGQPGELWLHGPGITPGYWNQPEATAKAFSDGWFKTGDIAVQDVDGYYQIIDRVKDMYITGGENVYPAEVEAVLTGLPGILEVAVTGYPDPRWGESGCAFVVRSPGAMITAETVMACCNSRLARYKHPAQVRFLDALPRTASGKVKKDVLRQMVMTVPA